MTKLLLEISPSGNTYYHAVYRGAISVKLCGYLDFFGKQAGDFLTTEKHWRERTYESVAVRAGVQFERRTRFIFFLFFWRNVI